MWNSDSGQRLYDCDRDRFAHAWCLGMGVRTIVFLRSGTTARTQSVAIVRSAVRIMDVVAGILSYARPSCVCSWRDLCRINKLCEISKWLLRHVALRLIRQHQTDPLLITYGSDCTPLVVRHRYSSTCKHLAVGRSGRSSGEWLVQRCFILTAAGDRTALFTEPRLLEDKTAWTHFAAYRELLPSGRECGHSGLIVQHFVYDRAVWSAMTRHHRQLAMARKLHEEATMHPGRARLSWLLSWTTSVACVNHDAHNSLRWAATSFFDCKDTCRRLFICLESLRQSFYELVEHLPNWIARSLRYEAHPCPEVLRQLWVMIGYASEWVDQLVELELRFEQGALKVHPRWSGRAELPDMLVNVFFYIWQWRRFSESRWNSLGGSCRALLGSLLVGLKPFVDELLKQPGVSTYYMKGFAHLDADASALCALMATSSFVADSALATLLEDDRVPRVYNDLMQEMTSEVGYCHDLDPAVWSCVASAVGMCAGELRGQACLSVLIQAGFFSQRLRAARRPPWCILQKDTSDALADLADGPRPSDETLGKIWDLLELGYPRPELERGLWLLSMAGWSSTAVEQAHVAASMLMKKHGDYGQQTLGARSMLLSMAPLVRPSKHDAKLHRLQSRAQALARRKPQCITGRQVLLKELNMTAAEARSEGRSVAPNMHDTLMRSHGEMWRKFPAVAREMYSRKAESERHEAFEALRNQKLAVQSEIELLKLRACDQDPASEPLRVSSCRLSRSDIVEFQALCDGGGWSAKRVDELRAAACERLGPPSEEVRAVLDAMEVHSSEDPVEPADWLPLLCSHRAFFQGCAMRFWTDAGAWLHCKFVFAMQSPRLVCFLRLRVGEVLHEYIDPADFDRLALREWQHTFMFDHLDFLFSDESTIKPGWTMQVLTDVSCAGRRRFVADGEWLALADIEMMLPSVALNSHHRPTSSPPGKPTTMNFDDIPWALDLLGASAWPDAIPTDTKSASAGVREKTQGDDHDTEHVLDAMQVMLELSERRQALAETRGEADPPFRWQLRGGAWTAANKGMIFDAIAAGPSVKGGAAEEWCLQWGVTRSASYSIALYGEDAAIALARAWVERHTWLFETYLAHEGEPGWTFTDEVLDEYEEPAAIGELFARGSRRVQDRISAMRRIHPRRLA